MAVNLASKYQKQLDQVYKAKSLCMAAFGAKFDFVGSQTAKVYTLTATALADYTRTGSDRYGTPTEVQDTVQDLTVTRDRSVAKTIDKGNYLQGNLVKTTGAYIKVQTTEINIPEVDTYAMGVISADAVTAGNTATVAVAASNAYEVFLDGTVSQDDNEVPEEGRIAFVSPTFYKFLKLDNSFIKASDMGQKMLINGQVGEVDGVKIVKVPSNRLPANNAFILTHPTAGVMPRQIDTIKTHEDPPGISGALIEFRELYDAFILDNKVGATYSHFIA